MEVVPIAIVTTVPSSMSWDFCLPPHWEWWWEPSPGGQEDTGGAVGLSAQGSHCCLLLLSPGWGWG